MSSEKIKRGDLFLEALAETPEHPVALASRAGMFPLEVNYYSGLVLIIVNLATLGASTLLPAMRFARSPIR